LYLILAIVLPKGPALAGATAPAQLGTGGSGGRWTRASGLPAPAFGATARR
jgi:hypothetical protein